MPRLTAYIRIIRLSNALMAAMAVFLGYWLSGSDHGVGALVLLICAAVSATGFGNVINDLKDVDSDRINHPRRPLPCGDMAIREAQVFAAALATTALATAFVVSPQHAAATAVPLLLLAAYALWLKGTPLAGNIVVALLVAYPIIFGGLGSPGINRLIIPAALAFLLNLMREIVKDIQDRPGDEATRCRTTAALHPATLRTLLMVLSLFYLPLAFAPVRTGSFGTPYLIACLVAVVPLHAIWFYIFLSNSAAPRLPLVSKLIKFEMFSGLVALAIDNLIA